MLNFSFDMAHQTFTQINRRHRQFLQMSRLGIAREIIENLLRITGDRLIAGKQGEVCVHASGLRMIIASAEMHIGAQMGALTTNHHTDLGMRFQLKKPKHHLHACPFEITG